jgi:Cro/C1-type HTH DNA-binding domain
MSAEHAATKLEQFLRAHGIKPAELARISGHARQHLVRIRYGRVKRVHPSTKRSLAIACGIILRRNVSIDEIFD